LNALSSSPGLAVSHLGEVAVDEVVEELGLDFFDGQVLCGHREGESGGAWGVDTLVLLEERRLLPIKEPRKEDLPGEEGAD